MMKTGYEVTILVFYINVLIFVMFAFDLGSIFAVLVLPVLFANGFMKSELDP